MPEISGIIFKNDEGKFELWTEFSLTKKETLAILEILQSHVNEGGSIFGCDSLKELLEEKCKL